MPRIPHANEFKTQREAIAGGAYILLPLEVDALDKRIQKLIERQKELGDLLGDAMTESSETFHDNAPAEAINSASNIMIAEFQTTVRVLRSADRIDYPREAAAVAIGNLVTICYEGDDEPEKMFITGYMRNVEVDNVIPNDGKVTALAAPSPLGLALLEAGVGSTVSYEVNSRQFKVGVVAIESVVE